LLTQVSESPVANVCDPNYTFVAKVAKRYLPTVEPYGSIQQRVTEIAAGYRAERGMESFPTNGH
jgi:hypothetical protein